MKNYIQDGDTLPLTAPSGGVVGGSFYKIGLLVVCAAHDAAETVSFEARLKGVFDAPKAASPAWTEGAVVYWDDSAKNFTTTSSGNTKAGVAAEVLGSGAGIVRGKVLLVRSI